MRANPRTLCPTRTSGDDVGGFSDASQSSIAILHRAITPTSSRGTAVTLTLVLCAADAAAGSTSEPAGMKHHATSAANDAATTLVSRHHRPQSPRRALRLCSSCASASSASDPDASSDNDDVSAMAQSRATWIL